ncbi:hypothetical protein BHC47_02840 [Snodgrassella alvi]|uniref:Transmembrane protein n=1 Tax=Snodgrassella alvi TaxID=1196083 RepID=A0A2N9Y601_9NEIS|nr:hypothetical protein BHC47_02840 [Snodgrassella alvi]PIT66322.1 hypothetical protein BHC56_09665 [Snodgrassella alvi]
MMLNMLKKYILFQWKFCEEICSVILTYYFFYFYPLYPFYQKQIILIYQKQIILKTQMYLSINHLLKKRLVAWEFI